MKDPKKLFVFLFICVFILAVCQGQGVPKKNPETITIKIFVEKEEVKCDPDPAEAEYGDDVIWKSDYDFAIDFGKRTPFKKFKFKAKKKEAKEGKGAKVIFTGARDTGKKWKFKYFVAVCIDGEIFTADPDLVIKP